MSTNSAKKSSALDTLRALGQKKPVAANSIAMQANDPAIAGAKRNKSTVSLGFDPNFADSARTAYDRKMALERAQQEFEASQVACRDYGTSKRKLYNSTFKADVTTVCVPFQVEMPTGHETKYVQVVCTNRYSVQKEMVLNNREEFGEHFDRLFVVRGEKKLRPNAEELIRNLLVETAGLEGEALETAISQLFETEQKVSTTENYETEVEKVPQDLQALLEQVVTRAQPALKFPG